MQITNYISSNFVYILCTLGTLWDGLNVE